MIRKNVLILSISLAAFFNLCFAEETPTTKQEPATTKTEIKAETAKSVYPIEKCVVSGEKLGEDGQKIVSYDYNGREIQFCCKGCVKDFEKDPAKYIAKLDKEIIAAKKSSYPIQTCVVSGEKLGEMGNPVDYVYNNQLVRFCCKGCVKDFEKDPAKYMSKLSATAPATETH